MATRTKQKTDLTTEQVLRQLEEFGTEQNRRIYARHGIGANMFGVSYGNLGTLRRQIKRNHALALDLWATGNHDARVLATMIADPTAVDAELLDTWIEDLDNYVLTDAFTGLFNQTPIAFNLMDEWMASDNEWRARTGWHHLAHLATNNPDLDDDFFMPYLQEIQTTIHQRKNRTREAMNNALIAIGGRSDPLEKHATTVAEAIGTVQVDHGDTNCKTPDAVAYIAKTRGHRRKKEAG